MKHASYTQAATAGLQACSIFATRTGHGTPIDACTFDALADRRLIVHPEADPVFVEQYRRLGAALHQAQVQEGIRSVMVASAVAAEGKTLSATNLALMLSRSFTKRVLLVDGDLRKPSVHRLLQLENGIGLSDILRRPQRRLPAQTLSPTLLGHHRRSTRIRIRCRCWCPMPPHGSWRRRATSSTGSWWTRRRSCSSPMPNCSPSKLDTCVMVVSAGTTASPVAARAVAAHSAPRAFSASCSTEPRRPKSLAATATASTDTRRAVPHLVTSRGGALERVRQDTCSYQRRARSCCSPAKPVCC